MHNSSTGNGSGRRGNKKENPVSNDEKNKNKKGNRALRKIYPSSKFYIYIDKKFPFDLTTLNFDLLEHHAGTERKEIWKIAFKCKNWGIWKKTFDISFWNQRSVWKEDMFNSDITSWKKVKFNSDTASIPDTIVFCNETQSKSTLSNEEISELMQSEIIDQEYKGSDATQKENYSPLSEKDYPIETSSPTKQIQTETISHKEDKQEDDDFNETVLETDKDRSNGEKLGRKLAAENLSRIAVDSTITKPTTRRKEKELKKATIGKSNKKIRYVLLVCHDELCIATNKLTIYDCSNNKNHDKDGKINKHQDQKKVSYETFFFLIMMSLYSYNYYNRKNL